MSTLIPLHIVNKYGYHPTTIYFNPRTVTFFEDIKKVSLFDIRYGDKRNENTDVFTKECSPTRIKFYLGDACNFRCSYCRQDEHKKKILRSITEIENVIDTIKLVTDLTKKNITVEFWGGEPFLYMDEMVKIVERLPKHIRYHIVTNGSLIDRSIYKWLKSINHEIILSHDGPGQCMRSGDPLTMKTPYKYLKKLYDRRKSPNDFRINTVVTEKNTDLAELMKYFIDYFDENIHIAKIEPVIPYNAHADTVAGTYASNDLEETLFTGMIHLWEHKHLSNIDDIVETYNDFLAMQNNLDYCVDLHKAKCDVSSRTSVCFDWKGKVYPCQVYGGTDISFGSIVQYPTFPENQLTLPRTMWSNYTCNCKDCLVVSLCRGVCPYLKEKYVKDNCFNKKTFYTALFRFILYTAGIIVTEIEKPLEVHVTYKGQTS